MKCGLAAKLGKKTVNMQHLETSSHHVSVAYADGDHEFWFCPGAPLTELAQIIGGINEMHKSTPIRIDIRPACLDVRHPKVRPSVVFVEPNQLNKELH